MLPTSGQLLRPCGSWPMGGDRRGLSLVAAAPGHARWPPVLSLPRRCRAGHHADELGADIRAAAAGPGARLE
jgi:hypothetical protein